MKRMISGCFKWLIIIIALGALAVWGINEFVVIEWDETTVPVPTPTVVVVNEIHYNFPVVGVIDYYIPGSVNVRERPVFDNNHIITTAEDGDEFLLLGITEDGVFFISELDGQTVFISVKAITILE